MEREMLPGNHKDKLSLICLAPTLPQHFFVFRFYIVNLHLFLSFAVWFKIPPRGSFSNCFKAGALLSSLARNLLFLEPSTAKDYIIQVS